jgi:ABC-type amino acid transport substrate-binding protein
MKTNGVILSLALAIGLTACRAQPTVPPRIAAIRRPVKWRVMGFADLLPALQEGQVDLVIAAMYITPQRAQIVDMSQPYLNTGLVVVVRTDETTINGLGDLPGKIVGVKEGATGARYAAQLKEEGIPITVRRYLETADSLEELEQGYVDAVFNDRLNTLEYIKTHPNLKIVGEVFDPASLGIAVRKDDAELLALINDVVRSARASGELDRLYAKWIGK